MHDYDFVKLLIRRTSNVQLSIYLNNESARPSRSVYCKILFCNFAKVVEIGKQFIKGAE